MSRKQIFLLVSIGVLALLIIGLVMLVWPYRGLLPLLEEPPQDIVSLIEEAEREIPPDEDLPKGGNQTNLPLKIPQGFSLNIFAKDLGNPRVLQIDSSGILHASLPARGEIVAMPDRDGDGASDETRVLLANLTRPHGFLFFEHENNERLAVAESTALSIYDYENGDAENRNELTALPSSGRHWTKTLLQPSDSDRMLISIGSSCDTCVESDERRATVQSFDPFNFDGMEPYAVGLRNAVFLAERNPGEIWVTEMGRDHLGDDLPPDEVNILEEGGDYGWPLCYGDNIHDTVFDKNAYIRNPCEDKIPSHIDLQAHSAPLGLAFIPSGVGWPESYEGNLLVAYHGSWNRTVPTGYKIMHFILDEDGNEIRRENFISGWLTEEGVLGRPADLVFDADGSLFISDDRAGVIYRVTPPALPTE